MLDPSSRLGVGRERSKAPVVVIGGGFSGLVAGCELRSAGVPVVVLEARDRLAGLAASERESDGFSHDVGMHIITNRLAAALRLEESCRDVKTFDESVLLDGRALDYPFGLMRRPKYWASAGMSRVRGALRPGAPESVADYFRALLGARLAGEVAIPLIEKMLGAGADELSPAAADRLPGVLRTAYLMAARRLSGRLVAIGYCRELPETHRVWHVYPENGIQTLCSSLAHRFDGSVHLNARVDRLNVGSGRSPVVEVNGERIETSAVVSSISLSQLARITPNASSLDDYRRFRYRSLVLVNLKLRGQALLPAPAFWAPEPEWIFFRLTEAPAALPWLAPEGHTMITADIGAQVGDEVWESSDHELGEICLDQVGRIVPDVRSRLVGIRVVRARLGYPIPLREYEAARLRLREGTGVPGLFSIGRNGEFAHALMEDVYVRTRARIPEILQYARASFPAGTSTPHG